MNVSFSFANETVQFDSNGNPPGWYDIMNFQAIGNIVENNDTTSSSSSVAIKYDYVQIGSWKNGTLELPDRPGKTVTSVCSEPCPLGQFKVIISGAC